ncbi:MAG: cell division protein ZapA [Myxococcales bacterium]|nr:cell division protein ZapA [Myxococcales bacterium]
MADTFLIEIAGAKYRMTSDDGEAHIRQLAAAVNARVEALGPAANRTATPAQLLALVALGLADDLAHAEARTRAVEQTTREAVRAAIARIDKRLEADTELAQQADAAARAEADARL